MCFDCWFSAIEHHHFLGRLGTCHGPGYVVPDMHDCWELGGFCQEAFLSQQESSPSPWKGWTVERRDVVREEARSSMWWSGPVGILLFRIEVPGERRSLQAISYYITKTAVCQKSMRRYITTRPSPRNLYCVTICLWRVSRHKKASHTRVTLKS